MNADKLHEIRELVKVGPGGRLMGGWDGDPRATALTEALAEVLADRDGLEEQLETYRAALQEAHDQLCGCDRPTNPSACIAPEETWGAFALLAASNPATKVCDRDGCTNPVTGYDAWGEWCDEHDGGHVPDPASGPEAT